MHDSYDLSTDLLVAFRLVHTIQIICIHVTMPFIIIIMIIIIIHYCVKLLKEDYINLLQINLFGIHTHVGGF